MRQTVGVDAEQVAVVGAVQRGAKRQPVGRHQAQLEQLLGVKGERYDADKSCGIRFYRNGCDIKGKPELWSDYINWQLRAAILLRQAMLQIDNANPEETDK